MSYNYFKEVKKWNEWKSKEEELLRKLNVSEDRIIVLREYDKKVFNEERRFRRSENVTDEKFFKYQSYVPSEDIDSISDLLDSIENEALYELLKEQDEMTLKILLLKVYGYSVSEIAKLMDTKISHIYYKIKKIKNFISSLK